MKQGRYGVRRGFTMIEILISIVITAFGLLGLAAFASKATGMSVDATQRARAAALLEDMASRVANNKSNAEAYVSATVMGAAVQDCTGLNGAPLDRCQWNNLLAGTNDAQAGGNSAFLGYRGCISQPNPVDPAFVITVAWGSIAEGIAPADQCAVNAFGNDANRRVIRSLVRRAALAA